MIYSINMISVSVAVLWMKSHQAIIINIVLLTFFMYFFILQSIIMV